MPGGATDELTQARRRSIARCRRLNQKRARLLRSRVRPDDRLIASTTHVLVTDRGIIRAIQVHQPGRVPEERIYSITFTEITGWALGRRHDERPLLRLRHGPHEHVEAIPAHRFFGYRWGMTYKTTTRRESTLPFNRRRDPALKEIVARLEADARPRGEDFVITLPGTREERRGSAVLYSRER